MKLHGAATNLFVRVRGYFFLFRKFHNLLVKQRLRHSRRRFLYALPFSRPFTRTRMVGEVFGVEAEFAQVHGELRLAVHRDDPLRPRFARGTNEIVKVGVV